MIATETTSPATPAESASRSWLRALELTASITKNPDRILADVIHDVAHANPEAPALLSDEDSLNFRQLAARSQYYARWAREQNLAKGSVVALLLTNQPDYFAAWLGISSTGTIVALINSNLRGASLAHCINIVDPSHVIVGDRLIEVYTKAEAGLTIAAARWIHGGNHEGFQRIDALGHQDSWKSAGDRTPALTIDDQALYIFTSGTTGLPKAAKVSHGRILQWSYWFAGMTQMTAADRLYNCLPMYHSIGGVLAPGAALVAGASVVIGDKFSASRFWSEVVRWECTIFQYIGEFCRYLVNADPSPHEKMHRIRMACGNGLAPSVWDSFKTRFSLPRVLEFYASTEGAVSLFNAEGKPGAIGRVPPYLAHRFAPALVRLDPESGEPVRDDHGLCVRSGPNEPGEALGKLDAVNPGTRFEGYTDARASEKKLLRDVVKRGDTWVRTGDLMRKDDAGFYYFVDRVGETFRWKGENVATCEVSEAICSFPGVQHAIVYGVQVPGAEGRAGMAAVAVADNVDLQGLRHHLAECLPPYARPLFLRLQKEIEVTGTFKYSKAELVRAGFNPAAVSDPVYFDNPQSRAYEFLDQALLERIQNQQIRL